MSGYRPPRFSALGAHVSGVSAWVLVSLLERNKALDSIQKMPSPERDEVLATYDTLRAAGVYWGQQQRGRGQDAEAASLEGAAEEEAPEASKRITAWEAAKLLNVTERRVTGLAVSGQLDGIKVRKKWMITLASVEDYRLAKDVA